MALQKNSKKSEKKSGQYFVHTHTKNVCVDEKYFKNF
jgi:hypothetical protein